MGLLEDRAWLAFYALTFVVHFIVTGAHVLIARDEVQTSLTTIALRVLRRSVLAVIFFYPAAKVIGRLIGHRLAQHSETRRGMIMDRILNNVERSADSSPTSSRLFDSAEKISPPSPQSAKNSETTNTAKAGQDASGTDEDWKGIVGFFHPFW